MRLQQSNQLQSHDRLREMANELALQSPGALLDGLAASLAEKNIQLRRTIGARLGIINSALGPPLGCWKALVPCQPYPGLCRAAK